MVSLIAYSLVQQGVCHIEALPFTLKSKGKRRIMEMQIFHHEKI
jgi:hypothetical protein